MFFTISIFSLLNIFHIIETEVGDDGNIVLSKSNERFELNVKDYVSTAPVKKRIIVCDTAQGNTLV
jgi:hypothetical protein